MFRKKTMIQEDYRSFPRIYLTKKVFAGLAQLVRA